jgi:hypothetical protein
MRSNAVHYSSNDICTTAYSLTQMSLLFKPVGALVRVVAEASAQVNAPEVALHLQGHHHLVRYGAGHHALHL